MGKRMVLSRKPAIIFIFITLFLDILGIGLVVPVLPGLIKELRGGGEDAGAAAVGYLSALYALMQFCFAPFLGSLSDRWGRRPVILISLLGSALDYLLLYWAPSFAWLVVGRAISGLTAANFSAATAYIADVTTPEKRAAGFGMIGAAFGLGFTFGPLMGGMIGAEGRLHLPFLVAAILTGLNVIYGFFVLPESLAPENRRPVSFARSNPIGGLLALRKWPGVAGLATCHFFYQVAHNIYPSLWVLYMGHRHGWDEKTVGYSLFAVGIMASLVQARLAGRVVKKLGEFRSLLLGLGSMALAMVGYGLAPQGGYVFAIIVIGAMGGISSAASNALMSQAASKSEQGALQGTLSSIASVASVVGPFLWTGLYRQSLQPAPAGFEMIWPGLPFLGAAIVVLIAVLSGWTFGRPAALQPTTTKA